MKDLKKFESEWLRTILPSVTEYASAVKANMNSFTCRKILKCYKATQLRDDFYFDNRVTSTIARTKNEPYPTLSKDRITTLHFCYEDVSARCVPASQQDACQRPAAEKPELSHRQA